VNLFQEPASAFLVLAGFSLLPFLFLGMTAYVKIATCLHIARKAIGADAIPENGVIVALAAALTLLAMAPVVTEIETRATPILLEAKTTKDPAANQTQILEAVAAVREPLRAFLTANSAAGEKARFLAVAQKRGAKVEATDFPVLVPAFVVTELSEAFAIGFLIFLPFLVIDVLVANVLAALGTQNLSAREASLPLKLLLFVAADGWGLLARALVAGYK